MPSGAEPQHWRFKLPIVCAAGLACVVLAVVSAFEGSWISAGLLVLAALTAIPQVVVIRSGRNPWWTRGFFDKRAPRE